jgi:hypothetical protein
MADTANLGGAIYINYEQTPVMFNNIFFENIASTGRDLFQKIGGPDIPVFHSNLDTSQIFANWYGEGNINVDPDFELGDTLCHLNGGSLCQNTGIESIELDGIIYFCPDHDYEGDPRPAPYGIPDIGADEHFYVGGKALQVTGYKLQVFPNPCSGAARLRLVISDQACPAGGGGSTILDLFTISGIKIRRLLNEVKKPGTYEMEIDVSDLPAGVYIVRLKVGGNIATSRLILINDY